MTRANISLAILLAAVSVAGCHRQSAVDILTLGHCDTVPPPPGPGALSPRVPGPRPPGSPSPRLPGRGAVVGWVAEAPAGPALANAFVALASLAPGPDSGRSFVGVQTDSAGGFALEGLAPGAYELRVRSIPYRAAMLPVHVWEGATDTLGVRLAYHSCVGY